MSTKNLFSPFKLKNGSTLKNRIVKSAMSENIAYSHNATDELIYLYELWAKGGCGLLITGNVMVDREALGSPYNVVIDEQTDKISLIKWANAATDNNTDIWAQLNHPGRQTSPKLNKRTVAPSAVRVNIGTKKMFAVPEPLSNEEIEQIIEAFGTAALICKKTGFTGVQIHGAHGYLVSQFLSPLSNIRTDKWGGSLENRSRFLKEVYNNIRNKVGADFPVGIKINSADFQRGGFEEEESIEVIKMLSDLGIDLIEVSGGTYEKSAMIVDLKKDSSTAKREAFFIDFIKKCRKVTDAPLLLTGGFRSAQVMETCIANKELDLIGMARPFNLYPDLPNLIKEGKMTEFHLKKYPHKKLYILDMFLHSSKIKDLSKGKKPDPSLSYFYLAKLMLKQMGIG